MNYNVHDLICTHSMNREDQLMEALNWLGADKNKYEKLTHIIKYSGGCLGRKPIMKFFKN